MTPVSEERVIYLDDYMDLSSVNVVGTGSGALLWPQPDEEKDVYAALAIAHPNMSVYKKEEIPERFHYRNHRRIPPILAIAGDGWTIRARESARPVAGGAHGYDNTLPNMRATFVAHGPAFKKGVVVEPFSNIHVYSLLTHILEFDPAPNDGNLEAVEHLLAR